MARKQLVCYVHNESLLPYATSAKTRRYWRPLSPVTMSLVDFLPSMSTAAHNDHRNRNTVDCFSSHVTHALALTEPAARDQY